MLSKFLESLSRQNLIHENPKSSVSLWKQKISGFFCPRLSGQAPQPGLKPDDKRDSSPPTGYTEQKLSVGDAAGVEGRPEQVRPEDARPGRPGLFEVIEKFELRGKIRKPRLVSF